MTSIGAILRIQGSPGVYLHSHRICELFSKNRGLNGSGNKNRIALMSYTSGPMGTHASLLASPSKSFMPFYYITLCSISGLIHLQADIDFRLILKLLEIFS